MPAITIMIKPTSSLCNMRCKYCFYADVVKNREVKNYGIMSEDTLENIVRKAFVYAEYSVSFSFQGGEPTLAGLSFYKKLIEFEKLYNKNRIAVYNMIQTNGYGIDDEWAKFFKENSFLVGVSLDGTEEIHDSMRVDSEGNGTFKRIENNLKLLDKYKVDYNILCVVNNYVAKRAKEVYNALKKYKYIQFIPCIDAFSGEKQDFSLDPVCYGEFLNTVFDLYYNDFMNGRYTSVRNFDNYIQILLGRRAENCAMNGVCACYFLVEGDGSVYPCDFYVLDKWKIGNVNTDSFIRMMKSEKIKEFIEESKHVDPKCRECKWFNLCRGGCKRNREPFVDEKPVLNVFCRSFELFFDSSYDKMVKMAKAVK